MDAKKLMKRLKKKQKSPKQPQQDASVTELALQEQPLGTAAVQAIADQGVHCCVISACYPQGNHAISKV